jgi:hypothetical protein
MYPSLRGGFYFRARAINMNWLIVGIERGANNQAVTGTKIMVTVKIQNILPEKFLKLMIVPLN